MISSTARRVYSSAVYLAPGRVSSGHAAALSELKTVLSGKEAAHGREHAACAPVLLVMAQLHEADGDLGKATELRQRAAKCTLGS